MIVYKRNAWGLIKSIVLAIGGAAALSLIAWIICSFLPINENISFIITCVVGLLVLVGMMFSAIFSENIRFEITPDGYLKYIENNGKITEYYLPECSFGYKTVTGRNTSTDLKLEIQKKGGETEYIDCSPLGMMKFKNMFAEMQTCQERFNQ